MHLHPWHGPTIILDMKSCLLFSWFITFQVLFGQKIQTHWKSVRAHLPTLFAGLCIASSSSFAVDSPPAQRGKELFEKSCSGCHAGGGNLFGGKTLMKQALLKNNVLEPEKMAQLILRGKGLMPAYGEFVSPIGNTMPAKLTNDEASAVVEYITQQADTGWIKQ